MKRPDSVRGVLFFGYRQDTTTPGIDQIPASLKASESHLGRRYQSSDLRERRELSLWRLGLEYWRRCIEFGGSGDWETLEKTLRDEVHHQAHSLE